MSAPLKSLQIPRQLIEIANRTFTLRMMPVTARRKFADLYQATSDALMAPFKDLDPNPDPEAPPKKFEVAPEANETVRKCLRALFQMMLRLDGDGRDNPPDEPWIDENVLDWPNIPDEVLALQITLNDGGSMGNQLGFLAVNQGAEAAQ